MAIRMKRTKLEERGIEQLEAQYNEEPDEVTKDAREFVVDMARGIGGGWSSRGEAFRSNYDRIFRRDPGERSL